MTLYEDNSFTMSKERWSMFATHHLRMAIRYEEMGWTQRMEQSLEDAAKAERRAARMR